MIVRVMSSGSSFKGLSDYLTHDPNAETAERVDWTHTLNCANDHVPSAVNEMVWTARDAELLKQEAGVRAGGRQTEDVAKHISLNWAPGEEPTREHMIETTESFLQHMKWQEHQAVLVAHTDKQHAHVHVMLNMIHPETGLRLDDDFERRKAQTWALEYERENGMIYCGQRLHRPGERQDAPTREAWMAFEEHRRHFEQAEDYWRQNADLSSGGPENPKNARHAEWQQLKEIQRGERLQFFVNGKSAFSQLRNSIYQEVRGEFRERWSDYFEAKRAGESDDVLGPLKAKLLDDQRAALDGRRDTACAELRQSRDADYRHLLDGQGSMRAQFRALQDAGVDVADFLDQHRGRDLGFRSAAEIVTARVDDRASEQSLQADDNERTVPAPLAHGDNSVGLRFGGSFFNLFTGWFLELDGQLHNTSSRSSADRNNDFAAAAEEASKRQQQEARDEADRSWREKERTRCWD